jgi:hypothetical protein
MHELTDTGFRDRNKEIIYHGSTLVNTHGDSFLVVLDPHLGYSLYNRQTKTIEKLIEFICGDLIIISPEEERNSVLL